MTEYEAFALKAAKDDREYAIGLRRHFHAHPECSAKEYETASRIEAELDSLSIPHRRAGETGVIAEIEGTGEGPVLLLRADIDALPVKEETGAEYASQNEGVMHACGHDAHTASLLGAAKILAGHRDMFPGTIRLVFQQGEEIGYGANICIDSGCMEGVEKAFGVHLASSIPVGKVSATAGPNNASVDWFRISIRGKGAHISTPELSSDALFALAETVSAIGKMTYRKFNPMDSLLVGIGKMSGGTNYNIIAENAFCEGTVRAYSAATRARAASEIENTAKGVASLYGCEASLEWNDFTSPLVNEKESSREVGSVISSLFGEENLITDRAPSFGGDDFARYIDLVPGCYAFVGSGNSAMPNTVVAHHNSHFDIDEKCLEVSVSLFVAYALDYLNGVFNNCTILGY